MKLDMVLMREILQALEAKGSLEWVPAPEIKGYSEEAISYHLELLQEREYIQAKNLKGTTEWAVKGLTWKGDDFLKSLKGDTVWSKVKDLDNFLEVVKIVATVARVIF